MMGGLRISLVVVLTINNRGIACLIKNIRRFKTTARHRQMETTHIPSTLSQSPMTAPKQVILGFMQEGAKIYL